MKRKKTKLAIILILSILSPATILAKEAITITTIDTLLKQVEALESLPKRQVKSDSFSQELGLSKVNIAYEFDENKASIGRSFPFFTKSKSLKKLKKEEAEFDFQNKLNEHQKLVLQAADQFYIIWGIEKKINLVKSYQKFSKSNQNGPLYYTLEHQLIELNAAQKMAIIKLRIILQIGNDKKLNITPKIPSEPLQKIDVNQYTLDIIKKTYEYNVKKEEVEVASANFKVADHIFSPDITLGADFLDTGTREGRVAPRLGVDFPVLSTNEIGRVKRIKEETEKINAKFRQAQDDILSKVFINSFQINAAADHIEWDQSHYRGIAAYRNKIARTLPNLAAELTLRELFYQEMSTIDFYTRYHSAHKELQLRFLEN